MRIGYTGEHETLRHELRAYYADLLTPELRERVASDHGIGPNTREVVARFGKDGLLGQGWPVEYGGKGHGPMEQFVFFDESMRAGAPVPMLTINTVGPTIMAYGTDAQKQYFLPKILGGEIQFCIGYSEPSVLTRSCYRWFGSSPRKYRKAIAGNE